VKLQIVSDLHLEFNDNIVINNAGADILCLAGDICLAQHLYRHPLGRDLPNNAENAERAAHYRRFFDHVSHEFDQVLYVMGNHEHYSGRWNDTAAHLREALEPWNNITLLDDAWLNFGNVRIVGTTLWTDLNNSDPLTMMSMPQMMSDYRAITINRQGIYHKLRPVDTLAAHYAARDLLRIATDGWAGDVIVLGHHAPSFHSVHEQYRNQGIMNGAFCSNLDEFIMSQSKIKLWIHGHVHNEFDYMIEQCRIICNPLGYPGEKNQFNPNLVIEI
jgi:Icc-related predicted phosphoesterase